MLLIVPFSLRGGEPVYCLLCGSNSARTHTLPPPFTVSHRGSIVELWLHAVWQLKLRLHHAHGLHQRVGRSPILLVPRKLLHQPPPLLPRQRQRCEVHKATTRDERKWAMCVLCIPVLADMPPLGRLPFTLLPFFFSLISFHRRPPHRPLPLTFNPHPFSAPSHSPTTQEDRRWRIGCRRIAGASLTSCSWTNYRNGWDAYLWYQAPTRYAITGTASYHDNGKEDRLWRFRICRVRPRVHVCVCAFFCVCVRACVCVCARVSVAQLNT